MFEMCSVRGPGGPGCTSCHGQTLMKIIEDVIREMCLLSEVAYGIITQSYTSLISIFHGFALPFINCMTLCHWRKCQRWRKEYVLSAPPSPLAVCQSPAEPQFSKLL